ncbi:MAG: bifunctional protein-serine/threonine kinase/phosphatase [Thiotrichaceae bacterium]|nr:bifunctional protein-serine/threonine kinase/phosphatase [Thiotrichaceae bacterium]
MAATSLSINAGQYSEKGNKPQNEDSCGILVPEEPTLTSKGIAIIIADGVSSAEGGREAAESCVSGFLNDYFSTPESWTVKSSGQRILGALNHWLYSQNQRAGATSQNLLTTMSSVVIKSTTAHLFHVGDSRIYHMSKQGDLECMTRDHQTWASSEKAFLNRAMGADTLVEIDYRNLAIEAGDLFLLTTDGVHEHINHKALTQTLREMRDQPERAAKQLVRQALKNGSDDNATCQVVVIESLPVQNEEEFFQHLTDLPFPPYLEPGMILDGYKILRELHASSRSQLYLAVEPDSEAMVAIKTPSVNFEDDAAYIDGFLHEEWAGRRINNNHVLKVLEPKQQRRFLYHVTEYIEGQTLRSWIDDNPECTLAEARNIIEQIAQGLRGFHRQEMLHQDLKPENLMIDEHDTVKIVDFGSTRIAGIQEINTPIERGKLLGTYDYAAPEYFLDEPVSNRSDIFSLGVIAYEMLSGGKLPYGKPLSKNILKHVTYIPAKSHNPSVPDWIDGALRKATHLDPERRYQLLSEFMHDLQKPNHELIKKDFQPLIERHPIAFWKTLAIISIATNLALLFL